MIILQKNWNENIQSWEFKQIWYLDTCLQYEKLRPSLAFNNYLNRLIILICAAVIHTDPIVVSETPIDKHNWSWVPTPHNLHDYLLSITIKLLDLIDSTKLKGKRTKVLKCNGLAFSFFFFFGKRERAYIAYLLM